MVNGKTRTFFGGGKEILDADLWEISEALGIARKETLNARNASITIFCDSQKAPKTIQQPRIHQENRVLRSFIYQKTGELQSNGHCLAILWIPSHSGLLENEKSELKEAEDYPSIGLRLHISRRAWLMYCTLQENYQLAQDKYAGKGSLSSRSLCSLDKEWYYSNTWKRSKKVRITVYQLKVGHEVVETFFWLE